MLERLSLARKIYLILTLIALALVIGTISVISIDEEELADVLIKKNLQASALNYFDSINTMMLTGTVANRKIVQQKMLEQEGMVEARIIRSDKVKAIYGEGFDDESARDQLDRTGLAGTEKFELIEKDGKRLLQYVMPVRASENYRGTNCLGCHQAQEHDILGAVKLTYDLSKIDQQITSSIVKASITQLILTLIGFGILTWFIRKLVLFRLRRLGARMEQVADELDFSQEVKVHHDDELGAVSHSLNKMIRAFRASLLAVNDANKKLAESSHAVDDISELTMKAVLNQKAGTDSVAAAINELDASANEVHNNTQSAADKSVSANQKAEQGLTLVEQAKSGINQLKDQVIENTSMITQLNDKTHEVGSVLEVITGIAEQTNLLALNAAIEAARAGEQGRGFAVVADEVRSLATRTRESIDQIQQTIGGLQVDANAAVTSMNEVSEQAEAKAKDVEDVAALLVEITAQIRELDELNVQIAEAAKQQNLAAEEINVNVTNISDVAEQSSEDAIRGKKISEHLVQLANELDQQIRKFKL